IENYDNVKLYRIENFNKTGSIAHGIAINDLVRQIDTKYGVILDADCTFLYKNWDEILINEINEECPIIGTQASHLFGSVTTLEFPQVYALFFDADINKALEINYEPGKDTLHKDTAYQVQKKYVENGYKGKLLKFKSTRNFKEGPFRKLTAIAEYYLDGYDNIFASHFGRGSTLGKAKYNKNWKNLIYTIPFIGPFILRSKGKRERNKWIKICKRIVDNL
ncbi:MAG: hypothetical protein ACFFBP_22900, partial [Promethearchaeota archaeon]